ncbi:MAG: hypothetical protein ABIR71_06270 [Chthoniobacterales bacterium]
MKNKATQFRAGLAACIFTSIALAGSLHAAELSSTDQEFLGHYDKVRLALAADNLTEAKTAASELGDEGQSITSAKDLAAARAVFGTLSERAVTLAKGQNGYYVAHCPMVKKSWVQTSTEIKNPYYGKEMLACGVIKE